VNTLETSTVFTRVKWKRTCAKGQKTGACPKAVLVSDVSKQHMKSITGLIFEGLVQARA
jgi:hypothetical protein